MAWYVYQDPNSTEYRWHNACTIKDLGCIVHIFLCQPRVNLGEEPSSYCFHCMTFIFKWYSHNMFIEFETHYMLPSNLTMLDDIWFWLSPPLYLKVLICIVRKILSIWAMFKFSTFWVVKICRIDSKASVLIFFAPTFSTFNHSLLFWLLSLVRSYSVVT